MKAQLKEKYSRLSDMNPGEVAVTADRKSVFICTYIWNKDTGTNNVGFVNLNYPADQYTDKLDLTQPVRICVQGDEFVVQA
jgi:hypothetical protein